MYGYHIDVAGPFDSALERVLAALKEEGFGVLSDIDIQKAMKEKLGEDMSQSDRLRMTLASDCPK